MFPPYLSMLASPCFRPPALDAGQGCENGLSFPPSSLPAWITQIVYWPPRAPLLALGQILLALPPAPIAQLKPSTPSASLLLLTTVVCSGRAYPRIHWVLRKLRRLWEGRELIQIEDLPCAKQNLCKALRTEIRDQTPRDPPLEELTLCNQSAKVYGRYSINVCQMGLNST